MDDGAQRAKTRGRRHLAGGPRGGGSNITRVETSVPPGTIAHYYTGVFYFN